MDDIAEKSRREWATSLSGLLMAVMLYLGYLALSLTDIWGYMPAFIQAVLYGALFMAMMTMIARGLMVKNIWPLKLSLKAAILSAALLAIGVILVGADSKRRLEIAVKPRAIFTYATPQVIITITPPAFSGAAEYTERMLLNDGPGSSIKPIPEGSEIAVNITHISYAPTLIYQQQEIKFRPGDNGDTQDFTATFTVKNDDHWQIKDGSRPIGTWQILILEDENPIINRAEFRPLDTPSGLFGLSLDLSDDYGLKRVSLAVQPAATDMIFDRTALPVSDLKHFSGDIYVNLTASDHAGQPVDLIIEAYDQAGQKQTKIISDIVLPGKEFSDPLARKIIHIRQEIRQQPGQIKTLARRLMALSLLPGDEQTPAIYYMALRSAYWRLNNLPSKDDREESRQIMWELAVTLEDGDNGRFNREILTLLARLKLSLLQGIKLEDIKEQLVEIDKKIVIFQRTHERPDVQEPLDITALRKRYSTILTHRHYNRLDQAIEQLSYLEYGFIYPERNFLSRQSYEKFLAISRTRDRVTILEETQRKIMAFIYGNAVTLQLASTENMAGLKNAPNKNIRQWIDKQQKLGADVNDMGRELLQSGIDISRLTVAAGDLARDALRSMESGDMEAAASYQSEIMTLLKSLKNRLNQEMQFRPKGL